jgi:hypothetical protein
MAAWLKIHAGSPRANTGMQPRASSLRTRFRLRLTTSVRVAPVLAATGCPTTAPPPLPEEPR